MESEEEENERMNGFEGYRTLSLSLTFFDHHVQTSVMNVDCAHARKALYLCSQLSLLRSTT